MSKIIRYECWGEFLPYCWNAAVESLNKNYKPYDISILAFLVFCLITLIPCTGEEISNFARDAHELDYVHVSPINWCATKFTALH